MASDVESPLERLEEHSSAVEPSAIEREFDKIWADTSSESPDDSSVRLRTVNFVALGAGADAVARFEAVMEVLPQRQPCRGVLAAVYEGERALEASISAHCWRAGGGSRHLCSEEVTLRGGTDDEHALGSAVLALLVPELPVATWVIGEPDLSSRLVTDLIEASDRIFIDTGEAADTAAAMRLVLSMRDAKEIELCDLAWYRLDAWRTLVAQLFDGEEGLRQVRRLHAIEITAGGDRSLSDALLFAGWLVSALELPIADRRSEGTTIEATLYDSSREVTLRIVRGTETGTAISGVRIQTPDVEFVVQLHSDSGHIHLRQEWPDAPIHRTVAPEPTDDASIFIVALDDGLGSKVYGRSLQTALALLGD